MSHPQPAQPPLDPAKFRDPSVTAKGEKRAAVALSGLRTLWVNTGTLCNITCRNCYIESSPRNDALVYMTAAEVAEYLDEIARDRLPVEEVGFTGGEPFLNRHLPAMLRDALRRGHRALVLTNAMKPMRNHAAALLALRIRQRLSAVLVVGVTGYGLAVLFALQAQRLMATHGATPEARLGQDVALFLVLTMFDMEFELKGGASDDSVERWSTRLKTTIYEFLGLGHDWPENWTPGKPFDNTFFLRNPEFRSAEFNTSFVESHPELTQYSIKRNPSHLAIAIATAIAAHAGL